MSYYKFFLKWIKLTCDNDVGGAQRKKEMPIFVADDELIDTSHMIFAADIVNVKWLLVTNLIEFIKISEQ